MIHHDLPNTFPLVTKFAKANLESISSIVLPTISVPRLRLSGVAPHEYAPCLHLARPCYFFWWWGFPRCSDCAEDESSEGFEDDLEVRRGEGELFL